jgi:tRNA threonylcarbamoyladenosine biosynthesis protein TsaB
MSHILCIETGTDKCSVALARDGELVALRESSGERDHAARVATYTDEVLGSAGISVRDLAAVAVSRGPGSYTGLRIGVSFAKGLCYGLGLPLVGVGSLDALCAVVREKQDESLRSSARDNAPCNAADSKNEPCKGGILIPMIDARRMEVFGQVFDGAGNPLTAPEAWIIDEGSLAEWRDRGPVTIFGSGAAKCRELLPWADYIEVQPSAAGMIPLATQAMAAGKIEDTAYFEPFYLKDFVVTTTKKKLF